MKRRAQILGFTAAALSAGVAQAVEPIPTGHVQVDFMSATIENQSVAPDTGGLDLFLPDALGNNISGYDLEEVRVIYDEATKTMYFGIATFGAIAGDVDGDGDPGAPSPALAAMGGVDVPDFGPPESFAVLVDFDEDGEPDIIIGVPYADVIGANLVHFPGAPANGFRVSVYNTNAFAPGDAFGGHVNAGWSLEANPSAGEPELEFRISNFDELAAMHLSGLNGPDRSRRFRVDAYMGSANDLVGEDFLSGIFNGGPGGPPPGGGPIPPGQPGGPGGPPAVGQLCPPEWRLENELCNAVDDDCDVLIDEDPLYHAVVAGDRLFDSNGAPLAVGSVVLLGDITCDSGEEGDCRDGDLVCTNGVESCVSRIRPGSRAETCDGRDNDCDGNTDEDPIPGLGVVCDVNPPGACGGTQQCVDTDVNGPIPPALICVANPMQCCNSLVEAGEDCDDGNAINDDGCTNECRRCDNGICDPGETATSCPQDCICGDGIISAPEECDDQNDDRTDGCDRCFRCPGPNCPCGNGRLDPGEECDDSNQVNDDGCTNQCTNGVCPGPECPCGNGRLDPGEECDDRNQVNDDGCTNQCTNGVCPGPECPCGNGRVDPGEQCDDGDGDNTDNCTDQCIECPGPDCPHRCGNGIEEIGEQCDDNNTMSGDGCSASCSIETPVCDMGDCSDADVGGRDMGDADIDSPKGRLTGADLSDNCSATPGKRSGGWLILLALLALPRLRRRVA